MLSIHYDIPYASAKEQVLDVYGDPAGTRPAVVLVHASRRSPTRSPGGTC
jgi:hypothetical protein